MKDFTPIIVKVVMGMNNTSNKVNVYVVWNFYFTLSVGLRPHLPIHLEITDQTVSRTLFFSSTMDHLNVK